MAGKGRFWRLRRAQILLAAASGSSDVRIAENLSVGVDRVPDEASLCRGRPRSRAQRTAAPGRGSEARGEGGSIAHRDGVRSTAQRSSTLDARAARRRDGATDEPRLSVDGDDPAPTRGKSAQTLAEEDVVHPEGRRRIRRADGGCPRSL